MPKKTRSFPTIIFLIFIVASCSTQKSPEVKAYSSANIIATNNSFNNLQDINASFKNIKLELIDSSLISNVSKILYRKPYLYILSFPAKVLQFDENGKFIRNISMQGNGPKEYKVANDIFMKSSSNNLFISDAFGAFLEYDNAGNYISCYKKSTGIRTYCFDMDDNIMESIQTLKGNEPYKLLVSSLSGDTLCKIKNNLVFNFTQKSIAASYTDLKSLFILNNDIIYHQMSTDTIFTYNQECKQLIPRCIFNLANMPKREDFENFSDKIQELSLVYDYSEDNNYRYITLITKGWKKQLYIINKADDKIYKSNLNIPGSDIPFYPKWISDDWLIDYYTIGENAEPHIFMIKTSDLK